jgi:YHS domain-containing protein
MMRTLDDRGSGVSLVQWTGRGTHWVGKGLWFLAWAALVAAASRTVVGAESATVWRTDFKAALWEAEQQKLPLLIHFYADWCMPCKRMEREVLTAPTVKEFIGRKLVAVKLNSDHHQDVVNRYGVKTLPSDVVIDSLSGKVLLLHSDFLDKTQYIRLVAQAEAKFTKIHAANLKQGGGTEADGAVQSAAKVAGSGEAELGEPQPIVGLDGFSPVALAKHRQWARGVARHAWDYKDVTYYLSTREELLEFRNNPEAFAPKLLGCDPVILWETDRAVAGDIKYGAFFDGELYLFKTDERRKQFKAKPDKFTRLQHALKIDQVERTAMR